MNFPSFKDVLKWHTSNFIDCYRKTGEVRLIYIFLYTEFEIVLLLYPAIPETTSYGIFRLFFQVFQVEKLWNSVLHFHVFQMLTRIIQSFSNLNMYECFLFPFSHLTHPWHCLDHFLFLWLPSYCYHHFHHTLNAHTNKDY